MKNVFLAAVRGGFLLGACGAALAQSVPATAPASSPTGQVTVYGILAVEALHATQVYNGATSGSQYRIDNSTVWASRLGFRGVEDLGGGTAAIFDLTSGLSPDTGAQSNGTRFWNRGAWVGLRSATFGTLSAGRHWNLNDDIIGRYFIFGGYSAFRFSEFAFLSDLVDNSVKYVSPEFGGFQARALVGAGEGATGRTVEVAVQYAAGPFSAGASLRRAKNLAGRTDRLTAVGASYTFGSVRLHAGWADSDSQASALPRARAYDLGVAWNVTPTVVATLDYVDRNQRGTRNDTHFTRLQGEYYLSKRTVVYGNLVALKNDGNATQRFVGTGGAGQGQNIVSLGLRHHF